MVIALSGGCVDVFQFELATDTSNKLIINGGITTLPGPQEIRVFRAQGFGESLSEPFAVHDATVYVEDDLGMRYDFSLQSDDLQKMFCLDLERDLGPNNLDLARNYRYVSGEEFRGVAGRSYTLHVKLADGTDIISTPQLLRPAIPIGELEATYVTDQAINEAGTEVPRDRWIVSATLDPSPTDGDERYLTWRYRGTFRIQTNPELFCDFRDCGTPGICIPQCCDQCWVTEYGQTLISTSAAQVNNLGDQGLVVATIPIADRHTESVYHLDLYQYRIAREVYEFYESLDQQLTNQGSIFDPPPYDEPSNLTYADSRDEPILGYFWAGGVAHEVLTISPGTITRQYNYFFPDDCQRVPGATTEKPDYYLN